MVKQHPINKREKNRKMKTTCWELRAHACKEGKTHRATENRQPTRAYVFLFFSYNCSLNIQNRNGYLGSHSCFLFQIFGSSCSVLQAISRTKERNSRTRQSVVQLPFSGVKYLVVQLVYSDTTLSFLHRDADCV
ncbi:unnamed protein product [Prunus brigantina]